MSKQGCRMGCLICFTGNPFPRDMIKELASPLDIFDDLASTKQFWENATAPPITPQLWSRNKTPMPPEIELTHDASQLMAMVPGEGGSLVVDRTNRRDCRAWFSCLHILKS